MHKLKGTGYKDNFYWVGYDARRKMRTYGEAWDNHPNIIKMRDHRLPWYIPTPEDIVRMDQLAQWCSEMQDELDKKLGVRMNLKSTYGRKSFGSKFADLDELGAVREGAPKRPQQEEKKLLLKDVREYFIFDCIAQVRGHLNEYLLRVLIDGMQF